MEIQSIKRELGRDWEGYRNTIIAALNGESQLLQQINLYLLGTQGKELRPLLSLLAARLCTATLNKSCYSAAAVSELLHTASLLHDDVADNGNMRHGVATVQALFSPAAAVLSGDYWLSKAMHLLAAECKKEVLIEYAHTVSRLAEGELFQMEKAAALDTTIEDYYRIIKDKTSVLFIAAMKGGALSAEGTEAEIEAIAQYALQLGYAFQIRDDIFDYSPQMQTGKAAGADIKERKLTLPLLMAFQNATPQDVEEITTQIARIDYNLAGNTPASEEYRAVEEIVTARTLNFVAEHNGVALAQKALEQHIELAMQSLKDFPDSYAKRTLLEIAQFVGTRSK